MNKLQNVIDRVALISYDLNTPIQCSTFGEDCIRVEEMHAYELSYLLREFTFGFVSDGQLILGDSD